MNNCSDQAIQNLLNNSKKPSMRSKNIPLSENVTVQETGGRSICLRIRWRIFKKLEAKSKNERRSINFLVNDILEAFLEN